MLDAQSCLDRFDLSPGDEGFDETGLPNALEEETVVMHQAGFRAAPGVWRAGVCGPAPRWRMSRWTPSSAWRWAPGLRCRLTGRGLDT